jgi:hypothetical protein
MPDRTIGEIALGKSTKLIFNVNEWRGRRFASVRKFVTTQKYEGWTKAGLALSKIVLPELLEALMKLERTIPPREEHEFGQLPKSPSEYIKIGTLPSEDEDGLPAVDVREFVDSPAYQGPTKRGIRFPWNLLPDVIACLREQMKAMIEAEKNEPTLSGTGGFANPDPGSAATEDRPSVDALAELLGEALKMFPGDFLEGVAGLGRRMQLPAALLRLAQESTGAWVLKVDDDVFTKVRNPTEGNFILYAQLRGSVEITVPSEMIKVFKAVKGYENYVRTVEIRLVNVLTKKARQQSVAQYEALKRCKMGGLPWLLELH